MEFIFRDFFLEINMPGVKKIKVKTKPFVTFLLFLAVGVLFSPMVSG